MSDPNAPDRKSDDDVISDFMHNVDDDSSMAPDSLGDEPIPGATRSRETFAARPEETGAEESAESSDPPEAADGPSDPHVPPEQDETDQDELDDDPIEPGAPKKGDGGPRDLLNRYWTNASTIQRVRNVVILAVILVAFYYGSDFGDSTPPGESPTASATQQTDDANASSGGASGNASDNTGDDTSGATESVAYSDLGTQPGDPDDVPSPSASDSPSDSSPETEPATSSSGTDGASTDEQKRAPAVSRQVVRDIQERQESLRNNVRKQLIGFESRLKSVESQSQNALDATGKTRAIENDLQQLRKTVAALEDRIVELQKVDNTLDERIAEVSVERTSQRPAIRLVGFANPDCDECVAHAIVYYDNQKRMLADGDSFRAFTVNVENDRLVLSHNELKKQFSYYPRF